MSGNQTFSRLGCQVNIMIFFVYSIQAAVTKDIFVLMFVHRCVQGQSDTQSPKQNVNKTFCSTTDLLKMYLILKTKTQYIALFVVAAFLVLLIFSPCFHFWSSQKYPCRRTILIPSLHYLWRRSIAFDSSIVNLWRGILRWTTRFRLILRNKIKPSSS